MKFYVQLLKRNKPIHLQPGEKADEALRRSIRLAQIREAVIYFAQLVAFTLSLIVLAAIYHTKAVLPNVVLAMVTLVVLLTVSAIALSLWKPKYKGYPVNIGGIYHPYQK